jgi:hypothetical protein
MKKALILAAMAASAVSSQANATAACTGVAGGGNYSFTLNADTSSRFVLTAFTVKCSSNVFSNYSEQATSLGVVAGSGKGKNYFGGGTGGGGVSAMGTCATTGCSATEASDANSTIKMNAS